MKKIIAYLLCVLCLTGCSNPEYSNSEKYSFGNTEINGTVKNIAVDWQSGDINIVTHEKDSISLFEESDTDLDDEKRVHWWQDGDTLRIKFSRSGLKYLFSKGKDLTLAIPGNIVYDSIKIDTSSADIEAEALVAKELNIETSSGSIDICCDSESIKLDTSSGEIDVMAENPKSFVAESSSGDISLVSNVPPSECVIKSSSGDVDIDLPENAEFTAKISFSSGEFSSDFALFKEFATSEKEETYVCGNGTSTLDIETTSGDISICKILGD